MTEERYRKYLEQTFDSFCRTLIQNENKNIHKKLEAQNTREITMSDLPKSGIQLPYSVDDYHFDEEIFLANGEMIIVHDPTLAKAIQYIPPKLRDVILLFYFLDKTEIQIGEVLGISQSTVNDRHWNSLARLKELLEELKEND